MCVGNEFQVAGAETENAREVKLLVMPVGLARRFASCTCKLTLTYLKETTSKIH